MDADGRGSQGHKVTEEKMPIVRARRPTHPSLRGSVAWQCPHCHGGQYLAHRTPGVYVRLCEYEVCRKAVAVRVVRGSKCVVEA
jgi:hypothetical protein